MIEFLKQHWKVVAIIAAAFIITNAVTGWASSWWTARGVKQVQEDAAEYQEQIRALEIRNAEIDTERKHIEQERDEARAERDGLIAANAVDKQKLMDLEAAQKAGILGVRELDTTDELEGAFAHAFPAIMRTAGTGIQEREINGRKRDYIILPAWTVETFLVLKTSADTGAEKEALLTKIVDRYGDYEKITETIEGLEARNADLLAERGEAATAARQECEARYEDVRGRYFDLAEKSKSMSAGEVLTCAGVGIGSFLGGMGVGVIFQK